MNTILAIQKCKRHYIGCIRQKYKLDCKVSRLDRINYLKYNRSFISQNTYTIIYIDDY